MTLREATVTRPVPAYRLIVSDDELPASPGYRQAAILEWDPRQGTRGCWVRCALAFWHDETRALSSVMSIDWRDKPDQPTCDELARALGEQS